MCLSLAVSKTFYKKLTVEALFSPDSQSEGPRLVRRLVILSYLSWFLSALPGKCRRVTFNKTTTAAFRIIYVLLFSNSITSCQLAYTDHMKSSDKQITNQHYPNYPLEHNSWEPNNRSTAQEIQRRLWKFGSFYIWRRGRNGV